MNGVPWIAEVPTTVRGLNCSSLTYTLTSIPGGDERAPNGAPYLARTPEFEGTVLTIQALELPDGSCPAGEFLDSLGVSDRAKLDVLFEVLGCTGRINNKEKFKKLEGTKSLWEFKSFQIRIPCFFTPSKQVMLCFGLIKKKDKYRPEEIRRAEEYQSIFLGKSRY